ITSHSTPARRWRLKDNVGHAACARQESSPTLQEADEDGLSSGATVGEGCGSRGDARQAKPHLEHNPFSLLGACHATPIRTLNDPEEGVRDLVMEICCALHNFQVRVTPWQPMV